jgi:polar amino acid transport system substrate-binding protein
MKIFRLAALTLAIALTGLGAAHAQTKEWKTVRIGTEGAYPPFNNLNAKGELEGFEIDYAKLLCEKMKVTCTFVAQDWDGIIPALLAGKYDVIIAGMNATDERRKKVDFSHTYTRVPPAFIGGKKIASTDVSPAALKGKIIGTQSSTIHANWLEKYYKDSTIKLYPTQEEANLDLANGRLDYIVADKVALGDFIKGQGKDCCKFIADIKRDPAIHGDGVAAAFRKEDGALRAMFDKAIDESMADGTFKKVQAKWFDFDIM